MGHYLACRYYKVDATLPYFIPAPPVFLAGTFGAFIKIRSAIPSRRALFDIGLAGPLAGFVVAHSVVGRRSLDGRTTIAAAGLLDLLQRPAAVSFDRQAGRRYLSIRTRRQILTTWRHGSDLLVTSLNLMPVGQLDGGHGTFALFGGRAHRIIGRVAFVTMSVLAVLGFWWHGSPSGFLYAVLLGIMMKVPHPQPAVMEPLGTKRIVIAIVTLIVFVLCFWPFPITIT